MNELAALIAKNNFSEPVVDRIIQSFESNKRGVNDFFSFLSDGFNFAEHPIFNTAKYIYKAYDFIHEKHLMNQIYAFIAGLNSGKIDEKKYRKFKSKVAVDSTFRNKLQDRLMLIIERAIDPEKANIAAKFLLAFVNEEISLDEFYELTEILDRLLLSDCHLIKKIFNGIVQTTDQCAGYQCKRLESLGLINLNIKTVRDVRMDYDIGVTYMGNLFCKYGLGL